MAETFTWDQSKFDKTLLAYLMEHQSDTWPRCLNKKAYFVALSAIKETPKTPKEFMQQQLMREIRVPSSARTSGKQGAHPHWGTAPLGYVLAAKRASKKWKGISYANMLVGFAKVRRGELLKDENMLSAWRALEKKEFTKMLSARGRAAGFIRVGWVSVMKSLGAVTGLKYFPGQADSGKMVGMPKGESNPANAGKLLVSITNSAHAESEKRGGFERIGGVALQKAFDREAASMADYLAGEMEPGIQKFNAQQK